MWFGTAAGLARYDGYRFKVFRSTDNGSASLPDNYIEKIVEDYASIWNYTEGKTESRFSLYEYPDFPFRITEKMSNLEIAE